ncbi:hypothetical protein CHLNCDRAFT_138323 [Chlorella variabilis]|uniref:DBP10 C-terminal domain-containing protein n=1 Tax=Chlorella variabilis TaxID=554065 RepID=E1ZMS7_CHLVA|nr:hypothetical protein CHLNCDRAFT_138323 [Chlorella variabilis]EFN52851.1 hypothetical protein CHLNCDRAFT_138323 [Chlorella variabilis]|eukprot:XP_005844953.1 hypothetical protein CHLNCDRAFT_138323 [Chlorella variabilis]
MRAQARARTQYHWDKRSKKYVKLQAGETIKAGKRVKTESGAKGSKGATGIYQKWAKKTRLRVASGGTEEQSSALAAQVADRFKRGGRGWANPLKAEVPNAGAREELRTPDQVRKAAKEEARKQEHLAKSGGSGARSSGGGSFKGGKPGGGGFKGGKPGGAGGGFKGGKPGGGGGFKGKGGGGGLKPRGGVSKGGAKGGKGRR